MSFLSGPECSTAGNPLTQFTKHAQDDRSLQRDRLVGPARPRPEGMRTVQPTQNDQMLESFLDQTPSLSAAGGPYNMDQMRRELESHHSASHAKTSPFPAESSPWASEFQTRPSAPHSNAPQFRVADFHRFQSSANHVASASPLSSNASLPLHATAGVANPMTRPKGVGFMPSFALGPASQLPLAHTHTISPQTAHTNSQISRDKGKGRVVELDDKNWEEQFAEIDTAKIEDPTMKPTTMPSSETERQRDAVSDALESETHVDGDFESLWRGIQAERIERGIQHDAWDHASFAGKGLPDELGDWDDSAFHAFDSATFRDPQLGDYLFEDDNVFRATGDPFGEGMRIMQEAGNLSLAALAFEAAVQKDPTHVEAWTMLGTTQAQNEKETPAIRALEQAVKLDPSSQDALMGLAVSYTNEGYDATAFRTLERWLSVRYPQVLAPDDVSRAADVGFSDRQALHERVTDLFMRAAQTRPAGAEMDPDVQVGLGVLFYGADDFDKAVDCFGAALASSAEGTTTHPRTVHLLWNRLGATLANSGRSEEAIAAYERALALNPNFVRARYNLGVSCINVGCLPEAAGHFLGALRMHRVTEREGLERVMEAIGSDATNGTDGPDLERLMALNQSTNLYETLRRVFAQMGRPELAERVIPGMDVETFRGEFDF